VSIPRPIIFGSLFALAACAAMPNAGLAPANAPAYVPANSVPPVMTTTSSELVGPIWLWQRTLAASGPVTTPDAPQRYTLAFQSGGRVNVQADCNHGSGSFEVNGVQMKLGAVAMTRMACPAGGRDAEYLGALAQTVSYAFDQEGLVLILANGNSMRFRAGP
jgi:heat shock protein HslJ